MFDFIIDSHCHLDLIEKKGLDIKEVIGFARKNNVKLLQTICTKISEIETIINYTRNHDFIYASCGNHPNNVDDEPKVTASQIIEICNQNPKIIGIGETGLDYHYAYADYKNQKESFVNHIIASAKTDLPLIIHSRNADLDMAEILSLEQKNNKFPALLHCFSSSKQLARKALDLGIYISISGIVTFKNALELQDIVKFIPIDSILVETDSPYLAPMPHRGQINQPAYTKEVVEFIANLKQIKVEDLINATTANFLRIFKKVNKNIIDEL